METSGLIILLMPLILIEVGLKIAALLNLRKQEATHGPRGLWVAIIVLVSMGWLVYFLVGRKEEPA